MNNLLNGLLGPLESGMCKLSLKGEIAVKTSNGYKTFNVSKQRCVNCNNFAIDCPGMFFVMPTCKVKTGDVIVTPKGPRAVIKADDSRIEVFNYENSTIETLIPERHMFMGTTYFYGKVVSLLGNSLKKGNNNLMQMMMLSKLMGGNDSNPFAAMFGGNPLDTKTAGNNNFMSMLPMMMMFGGKDNMFSDMIGGIFEDTDLPVFTGTAEEEDDQEEDD